MSTVRRQSKRVLSIFLTVAMLLMMLPGMALAAEPSDLPDAKATGNQAIDLDALTAGQVGVVMKEPAMIECGHEFEISFEMGAKPALAKKPMDVVLVLDISTSMNDTVGGVTKLQKMCDAAKEAVKEILSDSTSGNRVAIITFGTSASIKRPDGSKYWYGSSDKDYLANWVGTASNIRGSGTQYTNIQDAMRKIRDIYTVSSYSARATSEADRYVLLISDGQPTVSYGDSYWRTRVNYSNTLTNTTSHTDYSDDYRIKLASERTIAQAVDTKEKTSAKFFTVGLYGGLSGHDLSTARETLNPGWNPNTSSNYSATHFSNRDSSGNVANPRRNNAPTSGGSFKSRQYNEKFIELASADDLAVTFRNIAIEMNTAVTNAALTYTPPTGFTYVAGSAKLDGAAVAATVNSGTVTIPVEAIGATNRTVTLRVRAADSVTTGYKSLFGAGSLSFRNISGNNATASWYTGSAPNYSINLATWANAYQVLVRPLAAGVSVDASFITGEATTIPFSSFDVADGDSLVLVGTEVKNASNVTVATAAIDGRNVVITATNASNNSTGTISFKIGRPVADEGTAYSCPAVATVNFKQIHTVLLDKKVKAFGADDSTYADSMSVKIGDKVTYRIEVKNPPNKLKLNDLVVTDSMLSDAFGATPATSYTVDKDSIVINPNDTTIQSDGKVPYSVLNQNSTLTITFNVTFNVSGKFTNYAGVTTAQGVSASDSALVTVGIPDSGYDLEVTKTASATAPIPVNGEVTFTVVVTNPTGNLPVDTVTLNDSMFPAAADAKYEFVPGSLTIGGTAATSAQEADFLAGSLELGAMQAGGSKTVAYKVKFTAAGSYTNVATGKSWVADNTGEAPVLVNVKTDFDDAAVTVGYPVLSITKQVSRTIGDGASWGSLLTIDAASEAGAARAALLTAWQTAQSDLAAKQDDYDAKKAAADAAQDVIDNLDLDDPEYASKLAEQQAIIDEFNEFVADVWQLLVEAEADAEDAYLNYEWTGEAYFKIEVANNGSVAAEGVTISDTFTNSTAQLTFLNGSAPTTTPFTVPAGQSVVFYAKVEGLEPDSVYTNTANVVHASYAGSAASASITTNAVPSPSLEVNKTVRIAGSDSEFAENVDVMVGRDAAVEFQIIINNVGDATGYVNLSDLFEGEPFDLSGATGYSEFGYTIEAGQSVTLTYTMDVNETNFPDDGAYTNTAVISGDSSDENSATVTVTYPWSDVSITKTADKQKITAGTEVTYTLTVAASGNENLENVVISDDQFEFADGNYTISGASASVNDDGELVIDSLTPGATVTITYSVVIDETTTNTATVSGTGEYSDDEPSDSDSVTVTVYTPALTVTKEADPESLFVDDYAYYTITVTNSGDEDLEDVEVMDPMFSKAQKYYNGEKFVYTIYIDGDPYETKGAIFDEAANKLTIPSLAVDESIEITYWVEFSDYNFLPEGTFFTEDKTIDNTVEVIGTGVETETQTEPASAEAEVEVKIPVYEISLTKTANPASGQPALTTTYTLIITNTGNQPLMHVVITDALAGSEGSLFSDPRMDLSSVTVNGADNWYFADGDWDGKDDELWLEFYGPAYRMATASSQDSYGFMPGDSVTVTFRVTYTQDGTYVATATAQGMAFNEEETNIAEDSATVVVSTIYNPPVDDYYDVVVNYYTRPDVDSPYTLYQGGVIAVSNRADGSSYSYTAQTFDGYTFDSATSSSAISVNGMVITGTINGGDVVINLYYTGESEEPPVIIEDPEEPAAPPEEEIEDEDLPKAGGIPAALISLISGAGLIGAGIFLNKRDKKKNNKDQ